MMTNPRRWWIAAIAIGLVAVIAVVCGRLEVVLDQPEADDAENGRDHHVGRRVVDGVDADAAEHDDAGVEQPIRVYLWSALPPSRNRSS